MNHDTNTADITEIAALVDEQRHRLETWPELVEALTTMIRVAVLSGVEPEWQHILDDARAALARAKNPPASDGRHQAYAPSVDGRSVEDLHE